MIPEIDLHSTRAHQARLAKKIGINGYRLLITMSIICLIAVLLSYFYDRNIHLSYLLLALMLILYIPAVWWKRYLNVLPVSGKDFNSRLSADILKQLNLNQNISLRTLFNALVGHWQSIFILNHLMLPDDHILANILSDDPTELNHVLTQAEQLANQYNFQSIEPGFIIISLLQQSESHIQLLNHLKIQSQDITEVFEWLLRTMNRIEYKKKTYGGIARDWSFGFTPMLEHFGTNLSLAITRYGDHYDWLSNSRAVTAVETAFTNHSNALAIVGEEGSGKTSTVMALAQKLIEGKTVESLLYHQIIELKASLIISEARYNGAIEQILITLANEAAQAGHIIIFIDDAHLFLNNAIGSFDASQILLPIIQSGNVPIILSLTPADYQKLKNNNSSLSNLITPIIMPEMSQKQVMYILEDTAIGLEQRHKVHITYFALKEAYNLSGRYDLEEAYPGKAIKLLTQAVNHAEDNIVNMHSVQAAIEQSKGVKVSTASVAETDTLLHLEDNIHQRMINQVHAVSSVANSLRRARAGVSNLNRPIGSFLFLGPTGVGKTELAKAIAAVYFNDEHNMIRLDMSEYQQPEDVGRLLSSGQNNDKSLIMSVRQQPFAVVLFDEIEKAHSNILNLLLQLLDEGKLTDDNGRVASFKDCIIIATSNAGANSIRNRIEQGQSVEDFQEELTTELLNSNLFKPELLNRFDEMIIFRPLNFNELKEVVKLMLKDINKNIGNQNLSLSLTEQAIEAIVKFGNDPRLGARPMRRMLQKTVENEIAQKILKGQVTAGDNIILDVDDLNFNNENE